jgi:2-oxoglutarate ferredoxin oxidoreductase subunit beta
MSEKLAPRSLKDKVWHYCPGCSHGIVHRLIAEVIDELDIQGTVIGIAPVGCSYNNYEYFDFDVTAV